MYFNMSLFLYFAAMTLNDQCKKKEYAAYIFQSVLWNLLFLLFNLCKLDVWHYFGNLYVINIIILYRLAINKLITN